MQGFVAENADARSDTKRSRHLDVDRHVVCVSFDGFRAGETDCYDPRWGRRIASDPAFRGHVRMSFGPIRSGP